MVILCEFSKPSARRSTTNPVGLLKLRRQQDNPIEALWREAGCARSHLHGAVGDDVWRHVGPIGIGKVIHILHRSRKNGLKVSALEAIP